ncbi:MAG TPA: CHASE3 domain-containing protein [Chthoniobacteraceae bacterium]|nr:CHASE3 domain-containing protein [Chthoniobacteraceae bacterium]
MKWNIGTKIGGGFFLALVALAVIGLVSYQSTTNLVATADAVDQTHRTIENTELLLSLLKDAETGQRGFVITGEDRYLQPYNDALPQIDDVLRKIDDQLSGNPALQQRFASIKPLVQQKLAELKQTIDTRRDPQKGFEAARQFVLTDAGKNTMDSIRSTASDIERAEMDLLNKRSEDSKASADHTRSTILYGTLSTVVLLALVGFVITRNISRPLNEISGVAQRIAGGDLSVNVPSTERADEIGSLTRVFAKMTGSLQEMATLARQIAEGDLRSQFKPQSDKDALGNSFASMIQNLRRNTSDLSDGVNVLASSASEILASATQVASGAAETGTAISETTTTVEEVKQTAQAASQKARYVADTAQKATLIGQAGRKSVESSIDGMKRIQTQMESIAESVVRLSEQGQAIGEIIASVNDLAEQSNLLAVNAAIEAAKAGEQGRGFAVVAQEVKSLAEQSKQATAQVRGILGEIQKATTSAVLATEQGSKAVEAGVKQSQEAGESIRQLADSVTEAAQAATQIAASSQQQVAGTDQVAMAMENIKQASAQNMAGTKQTEIAAHNLHDLGVRFKRMVEQYKV